MEMAVVFSEIMDLHKRLHLPSINLMPGKLWTTAIDVHWFLVMNANKEKVKAGPCDGMTADVNPFSCGIWFNGWYAGEFDYRGGVLCAGSLANEDALIEAIRRA